MQEKTTAHFSFPALERCPDKRCCARQVPRGISLGVQLVGRIAPSPTGHLHLGHARSFLLAWWHVRSRGGSIVLRHEDLDEGRAKPHLISATERDLEWLGIDWDGVPRLQTDYLDNINAAMARLLEAGQAYPCVCSRADILRAQSAPHSEGPKNRYPGTCRGRFKTVLEAESSTGKDAGVRFIAPRGAQSFDDGFIGTFTADVQHEAGDFLIGKRDHAPAYQLAVVVDDAEQEVTEVLRGDDLAHSTLQQRLLQQALGLPEPTYFHVPLVLDESGVRLAKRHDALSLHLLREQGVDPRAIIGWVASSVGLDAPERVSAADLVEGFDLSKCPKEPVVFGPPQREQLLAQKA